MRICRGYRLPYGIKPNVMKLLEIVLIIAYSFFGIVTFLDIFLYEFFDIGEANENLITMALAYIGANVINDVIKEFPNILSNKFVKYPMYLAVAMMTFSTIKSML